MQPTDEMIEAGRMVLVDTTGHGYGPELVRAVWEAMRDAEAPAIVPDDLVMAAARATDLLHDAVRGHVDEGWKYVAGSAVKELRAALACPRKTEADIQADERERLAAEMMDRTPKSIEAGLAVFIRAEREIIADWLRSQGGEDE